MSFVFKPVWKNQGIGAKVIRVIGNKYLKRLDPFLMMDYFKARLPSGFHDHPHRGFQTVTYMQEGSFHHEDFKGHKGTIGPGAIQWMTAGKGILHAEMPTSTEQDSTGFQLWLNLKAKDKMQDAKYQQFSKDQIPVVQKNGVKVKLICGEWQGQKGPINYSTPAYYMDVKLPQCGVFEIPIKKTWNSIIYPYNGEVEYQCVLKIHTVKQHQCCVLETSSDYQLTHRVSSKNGAGFMLISGEPINEPIASYGPFVMNTKEEIQQTIQDYNQGKNGFENKLTWKSKIQELSNGKKYEDL